ncbi:MAG: hypothetical protein WA446_01210 [Steroidobacteraceae bacterium]
MRRQPSDQLPDSFDRCKLWTVGWQKLKPQVWSVPAQKRGQQFGVMIAGVVEHHDHASARRSLAQQSLEAEEALEGQGVEFAHHAHELSGAQVDRAKASHGLASRRMLQDGVFDLRRYPHAAARTVLLEVTFLHAPQFNVGAASRGPRILGAKTYGSNRAFFPSASHEKV